MDYCIQIANPYSNLRQIANLPQLGSLRNSRFLLLRMTARINCGWHGFGSVSRIKFSDARFAPWPNRAEWRFWRHHNRGGLCSPLRYRKHPPDACFTSLVLFICYCTISVCNNIMASTLSSVHIVWFKSIYHEKKYCMGSTGSCSVVHNDDKLQCANEQRRLCEGLC